ncbi:hypothetical protein N7492_001655 [Penicillium capsulatum]|uniref:Uncharacterized protein n=1 Tax=Penicillium capsulatum TaxID=69766 RepID=A0A9W9IU35_9EURO|nr:hypothetical protein N7492_001655 [Penicillium capsulatum]KAJ6129292.1 hypothetical protein N7512_002072 [Penicillium capsulatum]
MKSVVAICAFLAASISAAPLETRHASQVTVALSNDQSGAYAGVPFAADHTDRSILSLFGSTSVGSSGSVIATSIQLTQFPTNINCVLKTDWITLAILTPEKTFADLDGNPDAAKPVDLSHAVINCHA